jgi:hypothetical protein
MYVYKMHASKRHAYERRMIARETHVRMRCTALLAVKSVDTGALRHTSDYLERPEGTLIQPRVTPAGGEL